MSLTTVRLPAVIWKQFLFKMRSNKSMLSSLVKLQLFGLLLSFNGVGQMGNGQLKINYYSSDFVLVLTMFWGLAAAIILTTKANREDDFLFVSNRLSSDVSNMLLLLAASVIGAVASILASFVLRDIQYFFFHSPADLVMNDVMTFAAYIKGFMATVLYIYALSAIGYLMGALVRWHKSFKLIIPALIIGFLWYVGVSESMLVVQIGSFFFLEHNFLLFIVKVIPLAAVCFIAAIALFQRQEVR